MQLFEIFGSIALNGGKEAESTISNLDKKSSNLADKMKKVGEGFTKAGTKMSLAITAPIAGLATFGLKYNSTMQDLQTSFKVMLGSQEKAVAMTDKLVKLGAQTPFESTQLADYTKTMLSFGYTEENVLGVMTRLGDVSLGNNEKMSSLTRTMGQINSLGKLQGGDLNQLIGQGWNPLNEIVKKTGETTEEVRKRMSAGNITYKEVEDALVSATSKGGTFYKGMDEGSKTLSGRISTLKDNFSVLIGEVTKPIFDKFNEVLPKVIDFVGNVTSKFQNLSPEMQNTVLIVAGVVAGIGPLLIVVGKIISLVGVLSSALPVLGGVITALTGPIGITIAAIAGLIAIFVTAYKTNEDFRNTVNQAWESIKTTVVNIINGIVTYMKNWLAENQATVNSVKELFRVGTEYIKTLITTFINVVSYLWKTYGQDLQNIAKAAWEFVASIFKTQIDIITGIIKVFTALLKGDWQGALNAIKETAGKVFEDLKSVFSKGTEYFKSVVKLALDAIKNNFSNVFTGIKNTVGGIFDGVVTSIKNSINKVISTLNSVIRKINKIKIKIPSVDIPGLGTVGGGSIGLPQITEVPMLAKGGTITEAGRVIVGESGAELLDLPKGAKVTPLNGNSAGGITLNFYDTKIMSDRDIDILGDKLVRRLKVLGV
ncbi:tape measure protein [Acetivibrio cellulolyticus]|uniref:tape measure protein n=1 Tax=Acetivibrio cellulolyticus TaxID=35830 RepID=UPI0001E2C290|nr:tape measure protein [Acetivibrio cellulolyticus]